MLRMLREPVETVRSAGRAPGRARRRLGRGDRRPRRRRRAAARGAAELRLRRRGGAGRPAPPRRAARRRRRPRRTLPARLPHARRRRGGRGCSCGRPRPRMSEPSPEARLWDLMRGALATRALGDRRRPSHRRCARRRAPARDRARDRDRGERRLAAPHPARARERRGLRRDRAGRLRATRMRPSCCAWTRRRDFAHLFGGVWHRAAGALDAGTDAVAFPSTPTAPTSGRGSPRIRRSEPHSTARWSTGHGATGRAARRARLARRRDRRRRRRRQRLTARSRCSPGSPGCAGSSSTCPRPFATRRALGDRIEFVAGSFFESVPPGDVYVLSTILHDWDDEQRGRDPPHDPRRGARPRRDCS